jgi:hypothetical protein
VEVKQISFITASILRQFLAVSLALSPAFAGAESVVNLRCDVNAAHTYFSGNTAKKVGVALLEIKVIGPHVGITISSDIDSVDNLSVLSTPYNSEEVRAIGENRSAENKWEVTQQMTFVSDGSFSNTKVVVDRVTGILIVQRRSIIDSLTSSTEVSGRCAKSSGKNLF